MKKKSKSIVISFRLSPLGIAKAIDGLKNYDKSADLSRLSAIVKQVTLHGINYLTNALPWEPSEEAQRIVYELTSQGKQEGIASLEQRILNQPNQRTHSLLQEKKSFLQETSKTKSVNSTVSDFSIPEDLRTEIEENE